MTKDLMKFEPPNNLEQLIMLTKCENGFKRKL